MRIGWRAPLALALCAACSTPLLAHEGILHDINAPRALSPWDLAVLLALMVMGALYARGAFRLARRSGAHASVSGLARLARWEPAAFAAGWSALVLSILPPLDSVSLELFSVHMLQHEVMMLIGAPLLIVGRPLQRCVTGLPAALRAPVAHVLQRPAASAVWRTLTAPLFAWAISGLAVWVWHLPALYDAAVANEGIHALEHASFVGTSALFWWGMLYGRYGRAGYGAAVFYVFLTVVHTGILGAMVTFAGTPLYPIYALPAAAHGIDPLVDQQRAGLLMWIPAGLVMTLLGLALFGAWIGESQRRSAQNARFTMHTASGGDVP